MRILLLCHSFNSLTQRLFVELRRAGHEVSVEYDINDQVTLEAVDLCAPDLVLAPFLKRAVPEAVWRHHKCWIVHPGPFGDRGPAALDWALLEGHARWGVTVLQAAAEMDAGDVWAAVEFPVRAAAKSSLYRREVTEAAVQAVGLALARLAAPGFQPTPLPLAPDGQRGQWRRALTAADRVIAWQQDATATVLRKLWAADGAPGVPEQWLGLSLRLFGGHPEPTLRGEPGALLATRDGAVCRATVDGAVWITHLRVPDGPRAGLKLPAAEVLGSDRLGATPERPLAPLGAVAADGWREIAGWVAEGVGYLRFDFYNGAMAAEQCQRLLVAWDQLRSAGARVLVLLGGADFWSNGIHLHRIEAGANAADASWANIEAMNDLTRAIITTDDCWVIAALRGNAAAGGVFLALAADQVWAGAGVVLNPHYKNMGNLYGSEYWTYLLPRRVGPQGIATVMANRLPLGAAEAQALGLVDRVFSASGAALLAALQAAARASAEAPDLSRWIAAKRQRRQQDEAARPLADYRADEMAQMQRNFYGFDPSYHVARYNFVHRVAHSRTPLHLAQHRQTAGRRRASKRPRDDANE